MYMENLRGESSPEGKSLFHVFLYRLKKKKKKRSVSVQHHRQLIGIQASTQ